MPPPAPLLLVLDGNSLLHRAYHAAVGEALRDRDDRPVWALKGLIGYLARAAARLRPDGVLVGFDCPDHSQRKDDYPDYKAHRPAKHPDLVEQVLLAPRLLRQAGVCTVVATSYEADDVLASAAAQARRGGWRCVVMTSDRDAFALIDPTTSVLRVRNGGFDNAVLVNGESLLDVYGVRPGQYRDYAALRGDPSDNLQGVRGFGTATAARLLATFDSIDAAWAALDRGDAEVVRTVVGEAAAARLALPATREVVQRNRGLMRMRDDLPMPELAATRLPLDRLLLRRALLGHGINLGPSLWALTGAAPPTGHEVIPVPRAWVWTRGWRRRRDPTPGQLALF